MSAHRIRSDSVKQLKGGYWGFCGGCGCVVKVRPNGTTMGGKSKKWLCDWHEKEKVKAKIQAQRAKVRKPRKSTNAIRNVEGKRALKAPELKKLLRAELSRIVRTRDEMKCYVTGEKCEPGIGENMGQCAHLIPINDLPPEHRYNPRYCKWIIGREHAGYDGNLGRGRKSANQAFVWGKLAREEPDIFEELVNMPKARGRDKVSIHELRAQLERLRHL